MSERRFTIDVPVGPLEKGCLLVALPPLTDPNFHQSVLFLCETEAEGAMGLILNRPTDINISDALPEEELIKNAETLVFDGGPVQNDRILLLRRGGEPVEDFTRVLGDISMGGTMDALKEAATVSGIMGEYRPYRGYAGWGAGQLEAEINDGAWAVLAGEESLVFSKNPKQLWPQMMKKLGGPLAIYATMPPDISLN